MSVQMNEKCPNCGLVNYINVVICARCDADLVEISNLNMRRHTRAGGLFVRALVLFCVCSVVILGFYISLIATATKLTIEEKATVRRAIGVLKERGFSSEARLLSNFTVFRRNENWLNASVREKNAYDATN